MTGRLPPRFGDAGAGASFARDREGPFSKRSDQNGAPFTRGGRHCPGCAIGRLPAVVTPPIPPLLSYQIQHTRQKEAPETLPFTGGYESARLADPASTWADAQLAFLARAAVTRMAVLRVWLASAGGLTRAQRTSMCSSARTPRRRRDSRSTTPLATGNSGRTSRRAMRPPRRSASAQARRRLTTTTTSPSEATDAG